MWVSHYLMKVAGLLLHAASNPLQWAWFSKALMWLGEIDSVITRDWALRSQIQLTPVLSIWSLNLINVVSEARYRCQWVHNKTFKVLGYSSLRESNNKLSVSMILMIWDNLETVLLLFILESEPMYLYVFAPKARVCFISHPCCFYTFVHPGLKTVLNPFYFFHYITGKLFCWWWWWCWWCWWFFLVLCRIEVVCSSSWHA